MPKKSRRQKFIDIPKIKGVMPNILYSARYVKLRRLDDESKKPDVDWDKDWPKKFKMCFYCGRVYQNGYRMMGHLAHCQGKKRFMKVMREGLDYTVGEKTFRVISKRIKVHALAEEYEQKFNEMLEKGSIGILEAERLFFMLLLGAKTSFNELAVVVKVRKKGEPYVEESSETQEVPPESPPDSGDTKEKEGD